MTSGEDKITLYNQAKVGLKSLFIQTTIVAFGLIIILALTAGNPPSWLLLASFILGVSFVAWNENKRQSRLKNQIEKEIASSSHQTIQSRSRFLGLLLNTPKPIRNYLIRNNSIRGIQIFIIFFSIVLIVAALVITNLSGGIPIFAILIIAKLSSLNLKNSVDLSGVDLSDANLMGANLQNARLVRANLAGANLRSANLAGANLQNANLKSAILDHANLMSANLMGAILKNARVDLALFGNNNGIDKELKLNLISRGARFRDTPEDNSNRNFLPRH